MSVAFATVSHNYYYIIVTTKYSKHTNLRKLIVMLSVDELFKGCWMLSIEDLRFTVRT